MVVEIRFDGLNVKVRRFGSGRLQWTVVPPGGEDQALTQFSYERLRELGEGIWEMRQPVAAMS